MEKCRGCVGVAFVRDYDGGLLAENEPLFLWLRPTNALYFLTGEKALRALRRYQRSTDLRETQQTLRVSLFNSA